MSIAVLSLCVVAKSQDTVHTSDIRQLARYYVPQWLDSFDFDDYYKVNTMVLIRLLESYPDFGQYAVRMHTDDTLTVYGLAGGFSTKYRINLQYYLDHPEYMGDSSCATSRIYMRLYEAAFHDLQHIGEEKMVHLGQMPPSYYLDMGVSEVSSPWEPAPPIPMYECYFDQAVNVVDSFYVGVRYRDTELGGAEVLTLAVSNIHNNTVSSALFKTSTQSWLYRTGLGYITLFFPIIAPPDTIQEPDTTHIPDSTSILAPELVYRYTSVQPNPTKGKISVTSSFGLERLEAYDEKGNPVYDSTASGMVANIDVSTWRKGIYLLRIHTGAGVTTKKLLVE